MSFSFIPLYWNSNVIFYVFWLGEWVLNSFHLRWTWDSVGVEGITLGYGPGASSSTGFSFNYTAISPMGLNITSQQILTWQVPSMFLSTTSSCWPPSLDSNGTSYKYRKNY
jgi:hypothetical protein